MEKNNGIFYFKNLTVALYWNQLWDKSPALLWIMKVVTYESSFPSRQ